MKTRTFILLLFLTVLSIDASAQDRMMPNLDKVTIFSKGAQVYRHEQVALQAGEQTPSFTGLSPYTGVNSIQVKAEGNVIILGISQRFIRPNSAMLSEQLRAAEAALKKARNRQAEVKAKRTVMKSQLEMVKTSSSTAARTVATLLEAIKQFNQYYYDETMAINKWLIDLNEEKQQANHNVEKQQEVIDSIAGPNTKRLTVIDVKVDAPRTSNTNFAFVYYVNGASWYPTHEFRSSSTAAPLQLTYKASITQQTNEDWRNVSVTLSSTNPNRSNVSPELKTYWLDYDLAVPTYDFGIDSNRISDTITDEEDNPVIGTTVRVKGTTIGIISDIDGYCTLMLPNGNRDVEVGYIGMVTQVRQATGNRFDSRMENNKLALEKVVVKGFGSESTGSNAKFTVPVIKAGREVKAESITDENSMDVSSTAAKSGYEFEIGRPLTILSNNKPVSCQIGKYQLPTTCAYKGVPKIDKNASLVVDAAGWNELNLIQGETTVFFNSSYVGKTTLNPDQQSDTLRLVMGRDNGIRIERKLIKNNTSRRLLGSSRVQTMNWEVSLHNAQAEQVVISIYDQLPVSRNSNITVTPQELGGGQLDKLNGQVVWKLTLAPGEVKKLSLSYQMKYDKYRQFTIE